MASRIQDVIMRDTRANQPLATAVSAGTLYYVTDEEVTERSSGSAWEDVSDAGAGAITQLTGDVTAGPGTGSQVATIANNAVSNAKLRDSAALSVIGRGANSAGDPADIAATPNSSAVLRETGAGVVSFGTVVAAGLASDAVTTIKILDANVTYAKIQNVANGKLLGNFSGIAAAPSEYTLGVGLEHSAGAIRTKAAIRTENIGITVDGGGAVLTTGDKGFRSFPVAGTITAWRLLADAVGDIEFDVTLDDFASAPPTTSILTPDLVNAQFDEATGLSIAVAAGDVFGFEITGVPDVITRVTLELTIEITG